MSFLKAEWRKLIMANYLINPKILRDYLPNGTELDLYNDKCYVSLVGFMFLNTKLKGIKIPFHTNFQEVNLRFYVKRKIGHEYKRGVVFIKEIVPKPALTFVANTIYNENYQTLPMKHKWLEAKDNLEVEYQWEISKQWNTISVNSQIESIPIKSDSEIEFIAEHYWGYAKINNQKTTEYEVTHPKWNYYPLKDYNIHVDFEKTYGIQFSFLNNLNPDSVMLLEGSEITVENKTIF